MDSSMDTHEMNRSMSSQLINLYLEASNLETGKK